MARPVPTMNMSSFVNIVNGSQVEIFSSQYINRLVNDGSEMSRSFTTGYGYVGRTSAQQTKGQIPSVLSSSLGLTSSIVSNGANSVSYYPQYAVGRIGSPRYFNHLENGTARTLSTVAFNK